MPANVETMFYVREKPWHGLGTRIEEAPTSADALVYLPCPSSKISRAVQRLGAEKSWQCWTELDSNDICDAVRSLFDAEFELNEHLDALNRLAQCYQGFRGGQVEKFHTVFDIVQPETPEEAVYLAENIRDFAVVECINSAEEYGQHIAQEMRVDAEVLGSLDFRCLGQRRIDAEGGIFGDQGYVAYNGGQPEVKEIMARHTLSGQEPQMGRLA